VVSAGLSQEKETLIFLCTEAWPQYLG
jgi:hypothetical protein